ncbi:DUF6160 family protein [Noviherbaspirillum sp.]|uniref:DUF6160 family protein n=1 Tax=Noviherbaspirillum sp. TaxID=1926288 RepID=UPI002D59D66D|nr:DUF6160 family protein [Noviherbaspirillum sp.]HZW23741.1 DUF6160 family protein [Noviherbaspirillum sp.]
MKLFKKTAIAAVLSGLSMAASAMTPIADEGLSQVAGQDGVSIAASLSINIGSFVYTDTDANGGSISFNNIGVHGLIAGTLDIINQATFETILANSFVTFPSTFYSGGDVVQMAVPAAITVPTAALIDVTVQSIRMGNNTASFGSIAMNDIDLRGTTVWMWAH